MVLPLTSWGIVRLRQLDRLRTPLEHRVSMRLTWRIHLQVLQVNIL